MRFEEVLPALMEGKKIRRKEWEEGFWQFDNKGELKADAWAFPVVTRQNLNEDDWEIIEEPKKHIVWINFYKGKLDNKYIIVNSYLSKENAEEFKKSDQNRIACKRIEITEGEFDE